MQAMGWQPGYMTGVNTLKLSHGKIHRGIYRTTLVADQGRSRASAAHAFWHWLVIMDRQHIGADPLLLAGTVGGALDFESYMTRAAHVGVITGARFTDDELRVRTALSDSPVLVGLRWYEGMMTPDHTGFINAGGRQVGHHAVLVVGFSPARKAYRLLNSWGPAWGQLGRAWISASDLRHALIQQDGEACQPRLK